MQIYNFNAYIFTQSEHRGYNPASLDFAVHLTLLYLTHTKIGRNLLAVMPYIT